MTPEQMRAELQRANKEASDKRSAEAVKLLMIAIVVPMAIVFLFAALG